MKTFTASLGFLTSFRWPLNIPEEIIWVKDPNPFGQNMQERKRLFYLAFSDEELSLL